MMATMITMSHDYDAPARELWRIATDWNCLRRAVGKMVIFGPLPDEPMHKGQVIRTTVSLFGVLPAFAYTLKIREFDATAMHLETSESGGGIDRWEHTIDVEPRDHGSRLSDKLVISAGWMTPATALWARIMLSRRHRPRRAMLSESQEASKPADGPFIACLTDKS